eukprot:GILI01005607.1.p1 GENE.GILI01005607.1~~GILI01005607.1.p1  ORF type:complete len:304 (-),score=81.62 GILI01005607.1:187-1059(-)
MSVPVVVVTGGNRSLGLQVSKDLYAQGFSVTLACRDAQKAQDAIADIGKTTPKSQEQKLSFIRLDLADASTVQTAVAELQKQGGRLDVLINNAAVISEDRKVTYTTNVANTIAVTEAFLPLLVATAKSSGKNSRIINVGSRMGCFNIADVKGDALEAVKDPKDWSPISKLASEWVSGNDSTGLAATQVPYGPAGAGYSNSKVLLQAYTRTLAQRLTKDHVPVDVVAVCPGYTKTDINNHSGFKSVEEGADTISWAAYDGSVQHGKFYGERTEVSYEFCDPTALTTPPPKK